MILSDIWKREKGSDAGFCDNEELEQSEIKYTMYTTIYSLQIHVTILNECATNKTQRLIYFRVVT